MTPALLPFDYELKDCKVEEAQQHYLTMSISDWQQNKQLNSVLD